MKELIIDRVHTTKLGIERIKKNLGLSSIPNQSFRNEEQEVIQYCKEQLKKANVERNGKNWYASTDTEIYTINAYNHCIITAHKKGANI